MQQQGYVMLNLIQHLTAWEKILKQVQDDVILGKSKHLQDVEGGVMAGREIYLSV